MNRCQSDKTISGDQCTLPEHHRCDCVDGEPLSLLQSIAFEEEAQLAVSEVLRRLGIDKEETP